MSRLETDPLDQAAHRLFRELCELSPRQQALRLATDPIPDEVRTEVRRLLTDAERGTAGLLGVLVRPVDHIAPGTVIDDQYRIERRIGDGGMSTVYRACDQAVDRPVAIKLLSGQHYGHALLARFRREVELVSRLDHPNILRLARHGIWHGVPFLAMPLITGGSLRQWLDRKERPSSLEVLRIGEQIAGALAYSHGRGVVHRDVKPANILLARTDGRMRPLLADFGIALASDATRITRTGGHAFSPIYASPEQVMGADIDERSDLFSLGVTLFECLTGSPPPEETKLDVIAFDEWAAEQAETLGPVIGWKLSRRLMRSLHPLASRRQQSVTDLASSLAAGRKRLEKKPQARLGRVTHFLTGSAIDAHAPDWVFFAMALLVSQLWCLKPSYLPDVVARLLHWRAVVEVVGILDAPGAIIRTHGLKVGMTTTFIALIVWLPRALFVFYLRRSPGPSRVAPWQGILLESSPFLGLVLILALVVWPTITRMPHQLAQGLAVVIAALSMGLARSVRARRRSAGSTGSKRPRLHVFGAVLGLLFILLLLSETAAPRDPTWAVTSALVSTCLLAHLLDGLPVRWARPLRMASFFVLVAIPLIWIASGWSAKDRRRIGELDAGLRQQLTYPRVRVRATLELGGGPRPIHAVLSAREPLDAGGAVTEEAIGHRVRLSSPAQQVMIVIRGLLPDRRVTRLVRYADPLTIWRPESTAYPHKDPVRRPRSPALDRPALQLELRGGDGHGAALTLRRLALEDQGLASSSERVGVQMSESLAGVRASYSFEQSKLVVEVDSTFPIEQVTMHPNALLDAFYGFFRLTVVSAARADGPFGFERVRVHSPTALPGFDGQHAYLPKGQSLGSVLVPIGLESKTSNTQRAFSLAGCGGEEITIDIWGAILVSQRGGWQDAAFRFDEWRMPTRLQPLFPGRRWPSSTQDPLPWLASSSLRIAILDRESNTIPYQLTAHDPIAPEGHSRGHGYRLRFRVPTSGELALFNDDGRQRQTLDNAGAFLAHIDAPCLDTS